jgi:hypothetical protein
MRRSNTKVRGVGSEPIFMSRTRDGLVIAVAGFVLLMMGLLSAITYQTQYDFAKARLDASC